MKIVFALPGHLKTVPMGDYCVKALLALGHDVIPVDFRSRWHDKVKEKLQPHLVEEKASVNRRIRRIIERERPDLFISLFGFDISLETLTHIRQQRIPSACWWINDPFQFERSLRKAASYDFLFSNSDGSVSEYRQRGISEAHFLPTACDPSIHQTTPINPDYHCQICFAGDWSPLREQLVMQLHDQFDLKIFGPWSKKIPSESPLHCSLIDGFFSPREMARMFSSADIVLNLHTWHGKYNHGLNPRLFEAAGCGAIQLVDAKQEIPELFVPEREVFTYTSISDVRSRVEDILRLQTQERQAIGHAAQTRAYNEHTYQHRMARLLDVVGHAGA